MSLVGHRAALMLGSAAFILSTGIAVVMAQDAANTPNEDAIKASEETANNGEKKGRVTALDRLVVGAGVEKVAIDTPQAVSVVDQADIDNLQATEITDIVDNVAGVNATGGAGALGQGFNMRGIGGSESSAEKGRIILNVDGVNKYFEQYRMGGLFTDPELYKQVEILRGPASSTLYGAGALGGVVNFTTKDASDFLTGDLNTVVRLKGGYETNGENMLGAAILAHRFNENAEFLLSGNYRRAGNYTTGDGSEMVGMEMDSPNGLAKGTFHFGENLEQELRVSYQQYTATENDQEYNKINGGSQVFGPIDKRVVTDKTAIIAYQNEAADNPFLDLNIQASYSDTFNDQTLDGGGSAYNNSDYGYETYQVNVDNTFDHIGKKFENYLTIGNQTAYLIRTRDGSDSSTHPEGNEFQSGFFVQNEFIWDERLTIITGTRLDYQLLNADENTTQPAGTPNVDDWAFSPKIAALYKVTDDFSVFGSIAHTERMPGLDEIYDSILGPVNYIGLEKEKSNNFEIGFALSGYDLLADDDGVQLKTTAYYNDITNLIEDGGRIASPRFTNTGHAVIYGAEVELSYDSDAFYANAGYAFARGENKSDGGALNTVAPDEFFFTLGKRLPEQGINFGWTSRIVAAQNDTVTRPTTAAFDTHSAYFNWAPVEGPLVGWETQFRVDNIFDEQYDEYLEGYPSSGRSFKFTLVKQFGWS